MLPFLLRYSEPTARQAPPPLRYDTATQTLEILTQAGWVAAADYPHEPFGSTKKTGVGRETTDDD